MRWGTTPLICPSTLALFIRIASICATMLKSNGDKGSPRRRPFLVWKKCPTSSLILIATLPPEMKVLTQFIHLGENPFIRSAWKRKGHLTLSYAFSKSILRITPLCFFRCNSWTVSCKMTIPYRMFRPRISAVWVGLITWSAIEFSLLVATFVKILKLVLSRPIGRYCWITFASCTFGIRVITPKFKLKSGKSPAYRSWNICIRSPLMVFQNFW